MNSIFEFSQRILDIDKELLSKTYVHFLNKKVPFFFQKFTFRRNKIKKISIEM